MPGKNVVILGGGFGGATAAITLRKLLDTEHSVTIVDRVSRTYLGASMARLAIGDREPAKISRSLGALAQRGVRYHQAEIEEIALGKRRRDERASEVYLLNAGTSWLLPIDGLGLGLESSNRFSIQQPSASH